VSKPRVWKRWAYISTTGLYVEKIKWLIPLRYRDQAFRVEVREVRRARGRGKK